MVNTSKLARNQFHKDGKLKKHYDIILLALKRCKDKKGTAKHIADKCILDRYQVSRRLKEMVGMKLVELTGETECYRKDKTPSQVYTFPTVNQ